MLKCLRSFLRSDDREIGAVHIAPHAASILKSKWTEEVALSMCKKLWEMMKNISEPDVPMIHDGKGVDEEPCNLQTCERKNPTKVIIYTGTGYVKLYQLSRPNLSLAYDVVMLDEAQDANACVRDIVLRQRCPRIFVGDANQAIYGFLGACNAMNDTNVPCTRSVSLTRSFRFGSNIASVANLILEWLRFDRFGFSKASIDSFVVGGRDDEGEVIVPRRGYVQAQRDELLRANVDLREYLLNILSASRTDQRPKGSTCVICRTNRNMWQTVFHILSSAGNPCKVGFVGMYLQKYECCCKKIIMSRLMNMSVL